MTGGEAVLLTGAGKSGSKRLLRILDLSPRTHCRCEPNELPGSPFRDIRHHQLDHPEARVDLERHWDRALEWTRCRMGVRDRWPPRPKLHHRRFLRILPLDRLVRHGRVRRTASLLLTSLRGPEWPYPPWLGSPARLAAALPVLKTGLTPGWVPWLLENRPRVRIVNIIRHPGGFLASHIERWLRVVDAEENLARVRNRLRVIGTLRPDWRGREAEIDRMTAEEAELWYWRYVYEITWRAGCSSGRYLLVKDEDVIQDPLGTARRAYEFLGLELDPVAERWVNSRADHWRSRSAPWRRLLSPANAEAVERVLEGSELAKVWTDDQIVSRHDYRAY